MPLLSRALQLFEERSGVAVLPATERDRLQEDSYQLETFRQDASELAWHVMDYWGGRPQEMRPEVRAREAQKARIAFWEDPLAGAEADHYANFSIGRGIPIPQAKSKAVQRIIDEAWKDPNNFEKLTSFDALRAISNEMRSGANLFPAAFVQDGKVKIGFLEADLVTDIVPDPEDRLRPLYYLTRVRRLEWDFEEDRPKTEDQLAQEFVKPKRMYYPHWRNVEEAKKERAARGEAPLDEPDPEKLGDGLVYHLRVNRLLEQHFGSPPWRRTLRFFQAMNRFTEARVAMAQASASFIAKRVTHGGQSDVVKAAKSILNQAGEIGSARQAAAQEAGRGGPMPRPASIWNENESHKLESLSLNSGAAQAVQDGEIIRGAATAPSGFGQHYFGNAGNANLATASALELPALMAVGAWQEMLEGLLRWFTDLVIQEAVRAGRLGGTASKDAQSATALTELSIFEADQKLDMEARTQEAMDYKLSMPYPGRRNLPEVAAVVTQAFTSVPQAGKSETFIKVMLDFFFTHGLELEDPGGQADEVIKEIIAAAEAEAHAADAAAQMDPNAPPGADATPGGGGPAPVRPRSTPIKTADTKSTYGERRMQQQLFEAWLPDDLVRPADDLAVDVAAVLRAAVTDPAVILAANGNGHG